MPHWTIDQKPYVIAEGKSILDLLDATTMHRYLGARVGGEVLSLTQSPPDGSDISLLTYQDEAGRRIMERSLIFLYLLAVRDCFPGTRVTIEHAIGQGILTRIHKTLKPNDVKRIDQRMRQLVQFDLPMEIVPMDVQQAMDYFHRDNQMDKVRLLHYRPSDYFQLYRCGGMMQYFYGEMVPSLSWLSVFALEKTKQGIMLMLPDQENPSQPAPFTPSPLLAAVYAQSERWGEILKCSTVADLNDMTAQNQIREFIRINEALHEKSIAEIAETIQHKPGRVVFIAGPSSSGKTTFARRLEVQLRVLGLAPLCLSLDDYYRQTEDEAHPRTMEGELDFESLHSLDLPYLEQQLKGLLSGEAVEMPLFNFVERKRYAGRTVRISSDQPILIEGIHALNPELSSFIPDDRKYKIYVSCLTPLNLDDHNRIRSTDARLLRRLVRDVRTRNSPVEHTFSMWPQVRKGEMRWIFPYQEQADILFNSALYYEFIPLKNYAYPLLSAVTPENYYYAEARRLLKFLNYFLPTNIEDEIPPTSILREFIGGNSFYRS